MVCIAKADAKKSRKKLKTRHCQLEKALTTWRLEQRKPEAQRLSARKIAQQFGVAVSTLNDHVLRKHRPQKTFLETLQKLTARQERELVTVI